MTDVGAVAACEHSCIVLIDMYNVHYIPEYPVEKIVVVISSSLVDAE